MGIKVEGLSQTLSGTRVLKDVTFTAAPGRVTGFLGPNGAGKTTTLSSMLNLISVPTGKVTFGGRPLHELPRGEGGVFALFEKKGQDGWRTGIGHLQLIATAVGAESHAVSKAIDKVGLAGSAKRRIRTYSLGMRQRLGLAEILVGRPSYVLLDEPMNGLDPEGILWLRDLLIEVASSGSTVLVSSHMLNEADQFVQDVVLLRSGEIAFRGSIEDLRSGQSLEQAYLRIASERK